MMGQESYTASLAARFDLAGQRVADFDGTKFEPDGLVLAGGAGFEMRSLYQAVQYYQHALDRLYHLRGVLGIALAPEFQGQRIVTYRTAMSWFDKLITASAEKSRVWQAIAGRYLDLNRPNLARGVIERGYIQGYLESIFISQLMKRVLELADASAKAQVALQIEQAQRTYRASLREMRNVFLDISDEVTLFGFPPDFIPFPPLDPGETSGFELVLERALAKLEVAADKEEIALADTRDFDTDAASFQAALAQNELDTTTELANLCGWIRVPNGAGGEEVWPATAEFAHLDDDERTRLLQDPCGLMGNGDLAEAFGEMDLLRVEIRSWRQTYDNLLASIADEQARVNEQCQRIVDFKDLKLKVGGSIIAINALIGALGVINDTLDRVEGTMSTATGLTKTAVTNAEAPTAAVSLGVYTTWSAVYHITRTITDSAIVVAELGISGLELYFESEEILQGCKELRIDGKYAIRDLMREVAQHRLDGLRIAYEVKLQASRIEKLRNDVTSWEATREAQRQLLVDVEAARNDPNIRIYKNDAVRNADRTFKAALKEAYKATRLFEYYTSQSYAALEDLLLVRMVTHGNFTLEAYLEELAEAFVEFEETYGIPDLRVDVLSVRDHVFSVPRTDTRGQPLTEEQRTALFRQRLGAPALLDERGYITVPFATDPDRLSPLTGNHKIRFIEIELTGEDMGDELGRVYLTPKGTGTVRALSGERLFYRFPDPTAVIDVFFNGERPLDDALGLFEGSTIDIYRNERLRDRPLVNTGWELVLNLRDEFVNEDIRVGALSDIRLFLWYNDFTEL
jgi:hypothetical protein